MTEPEWQTCGDPKLMLEFLKGKASDRKLRLFTCACCRVIWSSLTLKHSREAVETAEQFADGLADGKVLNRAYSLAIEAVGRRAWVADRRRRFVDQPRITKGYRYLSLAAEAAHVHKPFLIGRLRAVYLDPELRAIAPGLLREVFGPSPGLQIFDPSWLTSAVVSLAEGIYTDRAFDRLPILADASQDAGCEHTDVLNHCRSDGPHVRGCWVVDLLLGKA